MVINFKKAHLFIVLAITALVYCPIILAEDPITKPENQAETTATTPATATASPPIGQVVWVKGIVKAIGQDKKERVLQRRDTIQKSDTLMTDTNSTGQVVFTDGGMLTLIAKSTIIINDYHYNKDGPASEDKSVVAVVKGGFRTITGAISKANPEGYKVNTPVATIGVRGTDFSISYSACPGKDCGASVKINLGSVQVSNASGDLVLTAGTDHLYTQVVSVDESPVISTTEPASLKNDIPIIPAIVDDAVMKASTATPMPTETTQPASMTGTASGDAATGTSTSGSTGGTGSTIDSGAPAATPATQSAPGGFCIY